MRNWIWLCCLTDILLKGLLSDGDPRVLLLQWGLSSLGFCSVSSDNFFVFRCAWLVLTHSWYFSFVYILFKKDTKIKKRSNILKKMNSLKKGEGAPLLNFEGGGGGPEVLGPTVLVPLLHHAFFLILFCLSWPIENKKNCCSLYCSASMCFVLTFSIYYPPRVRNNDFTKIFTQENFKWDQMSSR